MPTPRHKKKSVLVPSTKEDKERIVESLNTAMVDVTRQEMWPRQAHVLTVSVRRHFREGLFRNWTSNTVNVYETDWKQQRDEAVGFRDHQTRVQTPGRGNVEKWKMNKEALLSSDSLKHHLLQSWRQSPGPVAACWWEALENRVPGTATYT